MYNLESSGGLLAGPKTVVQNFSRLELFIFPALSLPTYLCSTLGTQLHAYLPTLLIVHYCFWRTSRRAMRTEFMIYKDDDDDDAPLICYTWFDE